MGGFWKGEEAGGSRSRESGNTWARNVWIGESGLAYVLIS